MTLILDKNNSKEFSKILSKKFHKTNKKGNLAKHFGKLKRNFDGLAYQISIRDHED
jgi:hypothetical protein